MELNLEAKNKQEELIKTYLQKNTSENLADKINNGTPFEKDGKPLINKKTLSGFMKYACDEARKLAEKGAMGTYVDDPTVYGWAVHYFEEESIEETLFNPDGTEFRPEIKKVSPVSIPTAKKQSSKPKGPVQCSLFDLPEEDRKEEKREPEEKISEAETVTIENTPVLEEKTQGNPIYRQYMACQAEYPDAVVAYRLGDFYEVFGTKASLIAQEADLTLTGRDCGLDERIPMVGFPQHISQRYFQKILDKHDLYVIESPNEKEYIKGNLHSDESDFDGETGEITNGERSEQEEILDSLFSLFENTLEVLL